MNHTARQVQTVCSAGIFGPGNIVFLKPSCGSTCCRYSPSALSSSGYWSALGASRSHKFRHNQRVCTKYANQVWGLTVPYTPHGGDAFHLKRGNAQGREERHQISKWYYAQKYHVQYHRRVVVFETFLLQKKSEQNDISKIQNTLF